MVRLVLHSLWARKRRSIGAGLAVVLGVAFLTATTVLGASMTQGIDDLFTEGYSGTDARVRSSHRVPGAERDLTGTVDAALVERLAAIDAVADARPVVEGAAQLVGTDGAPVGGGGPPTIGTNWVDFGQNPYVVVAGRAPVRAGEVVVDSGAAEAGGLTVGAATTVRVPEPVDVTVVGIAELRSGSPLGGVTFTWFDTATAKDLLLGADDLLTAVDLRGVAGSDTETLVAAIAPALPGDTEARTAQQLIDEDTEAVDADFLGFFRTFLVAFAVIALLAAAFSIHNTFAILVAQRTRETALLRAIGASRGQVLGGVAAEAVLIGLVAAGVGLGVGTGIAYGLRALLDAAGFGVPTAGLALTTGVVVTGMLVGVVVTTFAAVSPAVRAARVAPLEAVRATAIDRSGSSVIRAALGLLITAGGIVAMATATATEATGTVVALGALATFVGTVLLGPVMARVVATVVGAPIAAVRGTSGVLARRNAMRHPGRTWSTAAALAIGTAVVALFASLATSIKSSVTDLVERSFGGDLVLYPDGFSGAGLSPDLSGALARVDGVAAVAPLAVAGALIDGRTDEPLATDLAALAHVAELDVIAGDLATGTDGGVALGRDYAEWHGLGLGDTMTAEFLDGSTEPLVVNAIYAETALFGEIVIDGGVWERHTATPEDFLVMLDVTDDADLAAVRADVEAVAERFGDPLVEDQDEYLATQGAQIDQMLGLVYGLLGLAVLIALFGIANTLALSVHERTREIGLLRAVGQTRRQLRSTVRWESVIVAVFGTLVGLALGTGICWALVTAISASEGFGTFAPSFGTLALVTGVAVVAGVVAAVGPSRRAAKLDVLAAIATE